MDVAEFFVVRGARRRGVGQRAARALFELFPGTWEVRVLRANERALAFWRSAVGSCASFAESSWTAPSGRPPDTDWLGLFKVGTGVGSALWWIDTNGTTSGTATFKAPSSGEYVLRYINDYVSVQSVPITVQ